MKPMIARAIQHGLRVSSQQLSTQRQRDRIHQLEIHFCQTVRSLGDFTRDEIAAPRA
jgi:hypothetical protein